MTGASAVIRLPRTRAGAAAAGVALPPLAPRPYLVRAVLLVVLALSGGAVLHVAVVSTVQQRAAQQRLFDELRSELAQGTAPIGPTAADGGVLAIGAPVAYVEIPSIGLRQVIVEGTTSRALFAGPGHRRDTPLPGQTGTSVVLGRRAAFGGPFARIAQLDRGAEITVTTGQGTFEFEVTGVRREGEPLPVPADEDEGRLVLATADGPAYLPEGVLRVDAELQDEADPGPARVLSSLPAREELLGSDTSGLWILAFWLEVLVVVAAGGAWAWHRWGRAQAWVVFVPPLLLVSLYVSGQAAELLPNLL